MIARLSAWRATGWAGPASQRARRLRPVRRGGVGLMCVGAVLALCTASARTGAAPAPSSLTGRVIGADQRPIVGATVSVMEFGTRGMPRVAARVATGEDGRFAIEWQPTTAPAGAAARRGRPARVFADLPGVGFSATSTVDPGHAMTLQLLPSAETQLTLVDPGGKPAAGVRVLPKIITLERNGESFPAFLSLPEEASRRWAVETDGDGRCTIRGLPRRARVRFDTDDERFAGPGARDMVPIEGGEVVRPPPIHLIVGATITGRIRYAGSNKPGAGVEVVAQSFSSERNPGAGFGSADVEGQFRLTRLRPGRYVVSVERPEQPGEWTARAAEVDVPESGGATADLTLVRGGIVTGRVFDEATAEPFAHVEVGLHGPARPATAAAIEGTHTDAAGRYALRVAPGTQLIYLAGPVPDGYLAPKANPSHTEPIEVAEGQTVTYDFPLKRDATPPVNGVVVGPDGKPVAGARVLADYGGYAPDDKVVLANAEGRFRLAGAKPGTELRARAEGVATIASTPIEKDKAEVTLHVVPNATYRLTVIVSNPHGPAVPDGIVQLTTWHGNGMGLGGSPHPADAGGRVRLESLYFDTRYPVSATAPGFGVAHAEVLPPDPGTLRERTVRINLDATGSRIAGVVVDAQGTPVPVVEVRLNGSKTGVQQMKTDRDGKFSFTVVPDASCVVWVQRPNEPDPQHPPAQIAQAGQTDIRLVLPKELKPADRGN